MKLDVEGYEAEVLAGAAATLASPSLLAVETESQDPTAVVLLERAGFQRRFYDPKRRVLSTKPFAHLTSSNALFVRNDEAIVERLRSAPYRRIHNTTV